MLSINEKKGQGAIEWVGIVAISLIVLFAAGVVTGVIKYNNTGTGLQAVTLPVPGQEPAPGTGPSTNATLETVVTNVRTGATVGSNISLEAYDLQGNFGTSGTTSSGKVTLNGLTGSTPYTVEAFNVGSTFAYYPASVSCTTLAAGPKNCVIGLYAAMNSTPEISVLNTNGTVNSASARQSISGNNDSKAFKVSVQFTGGTDANVFGDGRIPILLRLDHNSTAFARFSATVGGTEYTGGNKLTVGGTEYSAYVPASPGTLDLNRDGKTAIVLPITQFDNVAKEFQITAFTSAVDPVDAADENGSFRFTLYDGARIKSNNKILTMGKQFVDGWNDPINTSTDAGTTNRSWDIWFS